MVDRAAVAAWVDGYERAWRTPGTEALTTLFTDDATYRMSPYEDDVRGRPAIAERWEAERDGAAERFTMEWELVAVEGDTGVVRLEVDYLDTGKQYRDVWLIHFAADGRCDRFEEWPFWPGKGHTYEGNA